MRILTIPIFLIAVLTTGYFVYSYLAGDILNKKDAPQVTFVIREFLSDGPAMIADKLGYYADEGLNVHTIIVERGRYAAPLLLSGEAQLAILGNKWSVLAQLQDTERETEIIADLGGGGRRWRVMARKDSGISTLTDLNDKKVGSWLDSYGYTKFSSFMKEKGINFTPVQLGGMSPEIALNAMKGSIVDAVLVWEPIPSLIEEDNVGYEIFTLEEIGKEMTIYLHARRDFFKKNPELVQKIFKALKRGQQFIKDNPHEAANIISSMRSVLIASPQAVENALGNIDFAVRFDENEEGEINHTIEVFREMGVNNLPENLRMELNDEYIRRFIYYSFKDITIEGIEHKERAAIEVTPFSRFEGDAFGLGKHLDFSALDFIGPFSVTSAIASGDFNNDGWQDILLGNRKGILLYKNLGTNKFALQDVDVEEINDLSILVVAFVDINNDGWQDIYLTSYGGKNYFLLNDHDGFLDPQVIEVPNGGAIATEAVSFADIDRDGDLDFINGNWFFGGKRPYTSKSAINKLILNENLQFQEKNLEEIIGETLSILFSDFTNDNNLDLIVGNDFAEPDIFYVGDATGKLSKIKKSENVIPTSAHATMSVDVADFNNDLYMDIYVGGISPDSGSFPKRDANDFCFEILNSEEKQRCENNLKINAIVSKRDIASCRDLLSDSDRDDCMVMTTLNVAAVDTQDKGLCEKIPGKYSIQKLRCRDYFTARIESQDHTEAIDQKANGNVLLRGSQGGTFQDVSDKTGTDEGRWTWNAKFADLDNDEWQDIYVANGRWKKHLPYSNVFFHNQQGKFFETAQEEFNLENFNMVVAYTYIDIDNDGDLDIISAGLNGPINVYINNETQNNSITFEFRDYRGNHFGIGNKIYIYYGENSERHQVREIKSGGGFLSFDAPIMHFGLGKYDIVSRIEIVWSTGEKTTVDEEFLANKNYVITRGR